MKVVGVECEAEMRKHLRGIGAVPCMPFTEMNSREAILQIREDPIADVFVNGHPAAKW